MGKKKTCKSSKTTWILSSTVWSIHFSTETNKELKKKLKKNWKKNLTKNCPENCGISARKFRFRNSVFIFRVPYSAFRGIPRNCAERKIFWFDCRGTENWKKIDAEKNAERKIAVIPFAHLWYAEHTAANLPQRTTQNIFIHTLTAGVQIRDNCVSRFSVHQRLL